MEYKFSFDANSDDDEVIAKIIKGDNKGKLIYINKNNDDENEEIGQKEELLYEYVRKIRITQQNLDKLVECVLENTPPHSRELKKIYNSFKESLEENNEIYLKDNEIQPVPVQGDEKTRQVCFCAAAAGSGKTTYISEYCKYFNLLYPKSPIFLFSTKPLSDEEAYKKIRNIEQVNMSAKSLAEIVGEGNDETNESAYQLFKSSTGQSLCIFDDIEGCSSKQEKLLDIIMNSILQLGRSSRIYCFISRHLLNCGKKTSIVWSEADTIVLFPRGLSVYSLKYAMKQYLGFDDKLIHKILDTKSRWVSIKKTYPKYVIEEHKLYFI